MFVYCRHTAGFKPILNNEINFLDVTNDGLKPGKNPNQAANQLWENIEEKLYKYMDSDRDEL